MSIAGTGDEIFVPGWRWLRSTRTLQKEAFGIESPLEGEALANAVQMNVTAIVAELGEFLNEVQWKPWVLPEYRGLLERDRALKELVDVGHFLANLLCAVGVTDGEWEEAYQRKQGLNRERQRIGYTGVKDANGRATDD